METCIYSVKIHKKDIALFKFIIESYENLAQVSTANPVKGELEIYVPSGNLLTVDSLLKELQKEINFMFNRKNST